MTTNNIDFHIKIMATIPCVIWAIGSILTMFFVINIWLSLIVTLGFVLPISYCLLYMLWSK
jgi:hypothetical protein